MNGFPYWQFHNERWLTGKVSSLDLDAQGLFLYFCMAAWASRGAFNICSTSVRLRFRKTAEWIADTLGTMVEIGILIEDGEKYRIKFIDEQIAEMNVMREKRSKAGRASAESRHNTRDEDNTKEEERKGKVTTVLESVQHGLNKCSTHVDALKPPSLLRPQPQPPSIPDIVLQDSLPPPISHDEAMAYADRIGMRLADAEACFDHFQSTDWQNEKIKDKPVRLSRDAAFAKMRRWKVRQARIDATDAAKRPASVSVAHEVKDYGESDTGGEI